MTKDHESPIVSRRFEVIGSIEKDVAKHLGTLLSPVNASWQPSDFLPQLSRDGWEEKVRLLRERARVLPDELLVVLVGDMITEEALPTYQTYLNRLQGLTDVNGVSDTAWARWSRGWTAEENRHGDLLNRYLYLTGRVDMHAVEVTIHHLLNNGFDPQTGNDPYFGFIYTSFQERATKISHRNVATLARRAGEETLHQICGLIAGDEARHEKAYKLFMSMVFEADPDGAVSAFATMMRRKITMPAVMMRDAVDEHLFARFSKIAQRTGVYTAHDYADIVEHLVSHWKVESLKGLNEIAAKSQEYLCTLGARYRALADRVMPAGPERFSWVFDREVG